MKIMNETFNYLFIDIINISANVLETHCFMFSPLNDVEGP